MGVHGHGHVHVHVMHPRSMLIHAWILFSCVCYVACHLSPSSQSLQHAETTHHQPPPSQSKDDQKILSSDTTRTRLLALIPTTDHTSYGTHATCTCTCTYCACKHDVMRCIHPRRPLVLMRWCVTCSSCTGDLKCDNIFVDGATGDLKIGMYRHVVGMSYVRM